MTFGLGEGPCALSSGQQAMPRFAAQVVGSIEQGSILLFYFGRRIPRIILLVFALISAAMQEEIRF
ncbi:hypothetical protein J2R96_004825 [Bradyrhizobium elkanii]|nr:hypothetical protein [Bradyrhizobium elkanii]